VAIIGAAAGELGHAAMIPPAAVARKLSICGARNDAGLLSVVAYRQVVVDMPPPNRLVKQVTVGGGSGSDDAGAAWGTCTTIGC